MGNFENDYQIGLQQEILLLEILRTFLNDKNLSMTPKYDEFDFRSINNAVELKRRFCNKDKYLDTMIGLNKISAAERNFLIRDYFFFFQFNDGLYYWKFIPEEFHLLRQGGGGRCDRGLDELKKYYFIPNSILRKVEI
jgi:hypothetical protein